MMKIVGEMEHTVRDARTVEVIRIVFTRGFGASPDSPFREVVQYRTLDGELLVEIDPCGRPASVEGKP